MELKGSRTEKNILTAFAGESQARNRYTYFASQAKKEGYVQMSLSLRRRPTRRKNMPKGFLNYFREEWSKSRRPSQPG